MWNKKENVDRVHDVSQLYQSREPDTQLRSPIFYNTLRKILDLSLLSKSKLFKKSNWIKMPIIEANSKSNQSQNLQTFLFF